MRLQIEPSEKIVQVHGTECRVWRGVSEKGGHCFLFIATISVPELPGWEEFQAELRELPSPGRQAEAVLQEFTEQALYLARAIADRDEHQRELVAEVELTHLLREVLEMVRDADEDCRRDGLPTMPALARAKVDAVLAKAGGK